MQLPGKAGELRFISDLYRFKDHPRPELAAHLALRGGRYNIPGDLL